MTLARLSMWTLALGLLAWALWLWPDVPAQIPVHVGLDGEPDRWGDRSVWSWLALPLVGLATAVAMETLIRWMVTRPGLPGLNLPNKEAILDLPPERRKPVLRHVADLVYAATAACLVAFALIQVGVWVEAQGTSATVWTLGGVLVAALGPLAALAWGLVRIQAEMKRQQVA